MKRDLKSALSLLLVALIIFAAIPISTFINADAVELAYTYTPSTTVPHTTVSSGTVSSTTRPHATIPSTTVTDYDLSIKETIDVLKSIVVNAEELTNEEKQEALDCLRVIEESLSGGYVDNEELTKNLERLSEILNSEVLSNHPEFERHLSNLKKKISDMYAGTPALPPASETTEPVEELSCFEKICEFFSSIWDSICNFLAEIIIWVFDLLGALC